MFDEMPDQFYQFLAATSRANTTTTSPSPSSIPLSFSLFHSNGSYQTYPQTSFDYSQNGLLSPPPHLLQHSHHHTQLPFHQQVQQSSIASLKNDHHKEVASLAPPLGLEPVDNPWSNDEVLSLLRIRSSLDNNWFPDFIWENVSRKLAEIGFKRSAEKCKEKFEEETRSFNSSNITSTCNNKNVINNYRLFGELEELYNNHADHHQQQQQQQQQQPSVIPTQPASEVDHHHDHRSPPPPPDPDDPVDDHQELEPSLLSYKDQTSGGNYEDDVEEEQVLEEEDKRGQERLGNDDEDTTTRNDDKVGDEYNQHSVDNEDDSEKTQDSTKRETARKRKRHNKFEMFKGFCESIVNKMIAQQEQLHCKILQDMVKRDEEKIVKQEAWKKQEIERIRKEMEVRAHEQAVVGDRQAKILDFLKKFTSNPLESYPLREAIENLVKVPNASPNSSILTQEYSIVGVQQQPTTSCTTTHDQNPSSLVTHNCTNIPTSLQNENQTLQGSTKLAQPTLHKSSQNPNNPLGNNDKNNDTSRLASSASAHKSSESNHTNTNATDHTKDIKSPESHAHPKPNLGYGKDDTGRRWPRDEVLALINIRCSLFNNNGDPHSDREGSSKGPLWERISQKMLELGYKRSAKRCKEKWENINKYFRKTKDLNKKRSIDSRTCPYFHQLSHIYSQGTVVGSPENKAKPLSGVQGDSSASSNGDANTTKLHASQGNEGGVVQVSSDFDFEF